MDIKEYVIDSNIFYMGIPFQTTLGFIYYITPDILFEIEHIKKNIDGLNLLITSKKVIIKEPISKTLNFIIKKSAKNGQFGLSLPDYSIIALSFQLNIPIMSTDYALINTAKLFSLETIVPGKESFSITKTKKFCSICKKYYPVKAFFCDRCGNKLIFKKIN